MAQIFNPWQSPPTEETLPGNIATFVLNGQETPEELEAPESLAEEQEPEGEGEHQGAMAMALQTIQQQSQLISQLMEMLGGKQ